ncbi:MAG: thiamine pyrophosphate-dependent dehydrogenase E1 component subunit alpha [Streptosporangiaceae bacterium]
MLPDLPPDTLVGYLRSMLVIRRFEETLIKLAADIDVGHFHVYVGQETTGVAALSVLEDGDVAFTTHRNHGHLLARGVDPAAMLAEILGRATGTSRGKGGTLHLASIAHGFPTTSSVTGGNIPLAVGAAFGFSRRRADRVSVCLLGDGALEEGSWHESANIAAMERLPVIFLCENNSLEAIGQKANEYPSSTMAASPLTALAEVFGIPATQLDGTNVAEVHREMTAAVDRARAGDGPTFLEARTVRWPGNRPLWPQLLTGETDLRMAWEPDCVPGEHRAWHEINDGLLRYAAELVNAEVARPDQVLSVDDGVRKLMAGAARFAQDSPYPEPHEALDHVFA